VTGSQRLKELYNLLDKIDLAMLGNDWQSKKMLKELRSKVVDQIKDLQLSNRNTDMVEYIHGR
jgi:hypothetical protein